MTSGLYDASRSEGFPAIFGENRQPVTADTVEAGWIFAFGILLLSFICIFPAYKGKRLWYVIIRVTCSCLIGLILMLCNFGMEWEVARLTTKTPYKAYTSAELESAHLGMKIGLRGVNVTLYVPEGEHLPKELEGETINYNERFWWSWGQGRLGFGPFAGEIQREFRRAQFRGAPLPILWIAEYFTFDGEGIRFGRHYMRAGWYAHIVIWSAFPTYLLANISFFMVLRYGAFFTMMTGLLQICGCLIWASVRNPAPLVIPFEDGALRTSFGAHFWLSLVNGLFCLLIGIVVVLMDLRYPEKVADFFGVDPLQDYEEHYYTQEELDQQKPKASKPKPGDAVEMAEAGAIKNQNGPADPQEPVAVLKRRTYLPAQQKNAVRRPTAAPRTLIQAPGNTIHEEQEAQENVYENTRVQGTSYTPVQPQ